MQDLCYGVCRWYYRLEPISRELLKKPFKSKDQDIFALVLIGIYQFAFMRTPPHAAINEAVAAGSALKKSWSKGLLNAVLRRYQREQSAIEGSLQHLPGFRYAHPDWLLERLQNSWPQEWQSICEANNQRAPQTLRVNRLQYSRDQYLTLLENAKIVATSCQWSPVAVRLHHPCDVTLLPGFTTGAVSIQDEAAQLAASQLILVPGLRVLDACAAPGGKTCHLLETEPGLEQVVALDIDAQRIGRIHENIKRLELADRVSVVTGDASKPGAWWDKQAFDRILLDAPCSATGVIRRHPDIKLLRRNQDIDKLAQQQLGILEAMWPLLKPGGIMLYATCSVLAEENEQVLARFLNTYEDAEHDLIVAEWGIGRNIGRTILPGHEGPDGFYYARLSKSKSR